MPGDTEVSIPATNAPKAPEELSRGKVLASDSKEDPEDEDSCGADPFPGRGMHELLYAPAAPGLV